ncbi:MAG: Gfo/Idh/MocA family oxidoreductase, partial [Candidatus Omnitrophica bacterium]|nr:Gfo/Idh/MocA family oxidoreductase [Candidatus Omnitrophota bacterium]
IAVDVPGCLTIEESGKKARAKGRCFLIDFQTRANDLYIEAIKRVHNGDIGAFAFGESSYHAGNPWADQVAAMKSDPKNPENRLRAWGLDRVLSGDIITEQNIHTLDVASWILDQPPIQAWGMCGHKVRDDGGDVHDSFQATFEYPGSVGISFSSRQFEGYGSSGGIKNRMYGADGVLEAEYGGAVLIRGKKKFDGGQTGNIFTDGVKTNIAAFHRDITGGRFDNPTVECSVRSNLVTILGRTAAYKKEAVRWDDLLKNKEKLEFNFSGMKD